MAYSARSHMTMGARRRRRRRLVQRLLIVLGVLGVLAAGGALWLRQALPQIAAAQIGRLLNAHVEMGKIQLGRNGLVSVAGLVVRPREQWPGTGGSQEVARVTDHGDTILRADKVLARFDRRSLLLLAPRVTELCLQGFLLDARLNLDTGRWNFETLRFNAPPRGRGGEGLPALRLQEGKLRYCKISGVRQEVVMSVPIEARFGREALEDPSYSFSIWTSTLSGGYGTSRLTGRWWPGSVLEGPGYAVPEPAELTLSGGLSSSDLPSLERAWAIDTLGGEIRYDPSGNYSLKVNLKGLHGKHAPEVDMLRFVAPAAARAGLGQTLQAFFTEYQPTGTVESITIRAGGNTRKLHESDVEGTVVCQDISICDVSFPYRIDHLRGELEFTPSTLRVNRLQGRHGDVEVCIDGWTRVSGGSRQYQYQITSPNMVLDQALYDALDPDQKRFWDAFRPTGTVAVDYRLTRTSPVEKRLALTVDLNDVTAVYEDFPYPLVGLTGTLFFDDKSILFSDVVSTAGSRRIRVNGRVSDPAGSPTYYLSVDAQNIPLDTTLRDALPTRHRELFRQFDLEGRADIRARVFSLSDANDVVRAGTIASADVPGAESTAPKAADGAGDSWPVARGPWSGRGGPWPVARGPDHGSRITDHGPRGISFLADVSCRQSSLKLPSCLPEPGGSPPAAGGEAGTGRPLVVSGITAEATITPVSLSIRKLEGSYGGSPVAVTGGVRFDDADGLQQCRMEVRAQRVPLDEATLGLLPPALSRQVAAFHPVGEVDLTVEVKKADSNEPPEYTVVLDCLGANIQHDRFAYPLQDIRGTIVLTKDNLILKNVTAKPTEDGGQRTEDSAVLRVDGSARVADGWFENGSFTLQATRLPFTERLGGALPPALAGPYRELVPEGSFDLDLTTLQVSRDRDADTGGGGAEGEILVEFAGRMNLGPSGGKRTVPPAGSARRPCRLKVSGSPMELSGVLETKGSYHTKRGFDGGRARLAAERLVVRGKTITDMNLEAIYDPNTRTWTAADFVGRCYGGKLLGNLQVGPSLALRPSSRTSDAGPEYVLQVAFNDVDLQQFLLAGRQPAGAEKGGGRELPPAASSGTMDAWLSLNARMGEGFAGEGTPLPGAAAPRPQGIVYVDIANMQVGKVSPLGTVLSVLRLNEPTDYTFERMLIDACIRGDKLLIPKLDLSGRNTAFAGAGTMDLPSEEMSLTLTARSRHAAAGPSVLQSLTEGLGGAVVRIEVTGTAGSPRVQTKALPVLEDSLRLLGTPQEGKKGKK